MSKHCCTTHRSTRFRELERLDGLFIDEVGQLNLELQKDSNTKLAMDGVFTIQTGNPKHLKPPD